MAEVTRAAASLEAGDIIQIGTPPHTSVSYYTIVAATAKPDSDDTIVTMTLRGWGSDTLQATVVPSDHRFTMIHPETP